MRTKDPVLTALVAIRKLLTPKGRWIQGNFAKDKKGGGVDVNNSKATCFCLIGAVERCAPTRKLRLLVEEEVSETTLRFYKNHNVIAFNDQRHRRHSTILRVLDKTIERLKAAA